MENNENVITEVNGIPRLPAFSDEKDDIDCYLDGFE